VRDIIMDFPDEITETLNSSISSLVIEKKPRLIRRRDKNINKSVALRAGKKM
jgi:hypothetical protein